MLPANTNHVDELGEPLLVKGQLDINASVNTDIIVGRNSFLRIRGNLKGSLTIEQGAEVVVEGTIDGKVVNRAGKLIVLNKEIDDLISLTGPPDAEAGGTLKVNLPAIATNWTALAKSTMAECGAVVKADAYGCGIDFVVPALAKRGCKTFFVSSLAEARRARAVAPDATIYVLSGVFPGTGPTFAEIKARPVIRTLTEIAEWDGFVANSRWKGGFALSVDTGTSRIGISLGEAVALAGRTQSENHDVTLLMSHLDRAEKPDHRVRDRQIKVFKELSQLYRNVPASLAGSSDIFVGPQTHFDLLRPGAALYGINPTPGVRNPMLPVIELEARIQQVMHLAAGESLADIGWTAKRAARVAIAAVGYADGYPQVSQSSGKELRAIIRGKTCPLVGRVSADMLAIDVTNLPDPSVARRGGRVTLIGGEIDIDNVATAARTTGFELLSHLGQRFHRIYHSS
jgi:alanine racemase